jgi:probable selenate reductase FAD-binding subunit
MKTFDYYRPESLKEAFGLMEKRQGKARYIAGGTDLIVRIKQKAVQPEALISLRRIEALKGRSPNGGLALGSMTLLRQIERDPLIADRYPALSEAVRCLANPQVRNVATIGGNICNAAPSADSAPPLLVMGAEVVLEGPGGKRRIPLDAFFKGPGQTCMGPGELLTEVYLPEISGPAGSAFLKIGRVTQDLAVANAAALLVMENGVCRTCRLAAGAVAPVPLRLRKAEKVVEGQRIDRDLLERVAAVVEREVSPITDVRSTEAYRRVVSGVLVKRAITAALKVACRSV